ncbi:MAG: hypothetical protein R3Y43_04245 [Alphaproteobacteria bacterium]
MYKGNDVLFLLSEPDEVVGIGFASIHNETSKLKIMVEDAPFLEVGEEIEYQDIAYKVMSEPKRDIHRLVWEADVLIGDL